MLLKSMRRIAPVSVERTCVYCGEIQYFPAPVLPVAPRETLNHELLLERAHAACAVEAEAARIRTEEPAFVMVGTSLTEDPGPLKAALRKSRLFYSPAPTSGGLLSSLVPAAAEMFVRTGRLAEEAALAERDGVISPDEAQAIGAECGEARAVLDSIEISADVAAGRRLAS